MLLVAVALDFALPVTVFALFGGRARHWLNVGRTWMVEHDRQISLAVLFGFGTLFTVEALGGLL